MPFRKCQRRPVSQIGRRLDARQSSAVVRGRDGRQKLELLMAGELADMVFTDPPYNVDYSQKKKVHSAEAANRK